MKGTRKMQKKLVDAVAAARDEALMEIGREAAQRQEARVGQARRRSAGMMALGAVAAGAALIGGAVLLRRRRRGQEPPVTLSGRPTPP